MDGDLQEQLIKDLLVESFEGLERYDQELLALESGQDSAESLNNIFRIIHTIKGTSGCIGLSKIESVAHVGENLLSLVRDGKLQVSSEMISTLLSLSDALNEMLRSLEANGNEGDTDYAELLTKLEVLQKDPSEVEAEKKEEEKPAFGIFAEEEQAVTGQADVQGATQKPVEEKATFGIFAEEDQQESKAEEPKPVEAPKLQKPKELEKKAAVVPQKSSVAESAIRVDVEQLDKLMNLVGELVLARNQILQHTSNTEESSLLAASQRLNLITTELQERVMKTRMQPIGNIWSKFPRIVRDVSTELGKRVRLEMNGKETELDRTIIEAIKDPLTHIIRNAIDHGIEPPEEREAAQKPEEGFLLLRAFHEGGQVNIEIMDDGRGINVEKVKEKAVQKGVLSPDHAARMSDREAFGLIFQPGFSTAAQVTNLSGRGVGMDVVKTNIEKIGGCVDVHSEWGQGSTIKIKIPLTLAIIPALIVTSGGERFAIPQVSLLELVRLDREQDEQRIETISGTPVYRLRGNLLPLIYLNRELHLDQQTEESEDSGKVDGDVFEEETEVRRERSSENIVVLRADGRTFGLVVDEINDTEEIVVKPLGKNLKNLAFYSGATIMGDGQVALILDVLGLAQHARVVSEVRNEGVVDEQARNQAAGDERETFLLFGVGEEDRMAIPLSMVDRLEEFSPDSIEYTGGQEVVQYRGQILPLIRVSSYVKTTEEMPVSTSSGGDESAGEKKKQPVQVVVYSEQGRSVGLVVGKIRDIAEEVLKVKRNAKAGNLLGSAVIQDRVTDLLDVAGMVRKVDPEFGSEEKKNVSEE